MAEKPELTILNSSADLKIGQRKRNFFIHISDDYETAEFNGKPQDAIMLRGWLNEYLENLNRVNE